MAETRSRLVDCFAVVFPTLDRDEIPHATTESVEEWDSLASANLIVVVAEEFGVEIGPDEIGYFVSFEQILHFLDRAQPGP